MNLVLFNSVGLSVSEAAKLCNYMHFRKAECPMKNKAFQRANYDKSLDFMDSLEEDIPKGLFPPYRVVKVSLVSLKPSYRHL